MRYGEAGERGWAWVLGHVRWDDGPWIPEALDDVEPRSGYRDGVHSGAGGLALVLGEIARTRPWTADEQVLAEGLVDRLHGTVATTVDASMFDGLPRPPRRPDRAWRRRPGPGRRPAARPRRGRRVADVGGRRTSLRPGGAGQRPDARHRRCAARRRRGRATGPPARP
ncbi:hypothetical protein [Nocardioides sp. TF02-7]|uniref:hypothetical protein n=1 Tax=Nocardioides sp. TF02-7 TaxID=2917724 RepID=UPI001F063525|nr:hypothetical protein [Nocardioides sp. TF02-7]UMG92690.1 hypothetical protein MF408_23660 [Nocardioides sp. TF02-7]